MPTKNPPVILEKFYDSSVPFELSIDEVGRGCMFGRVYVACVVTVSYTHLTLPTTPYV